MRYLFIVICSALLCAGCFTSDVLYKAKHDRKRERVKVVMTSYKDTSGNAVVVYKKRNRKSVYKAVVPLDSILHKYKTANKDYLFNRDSTMVNFLGVFSVKDKKEQNEVKRIVLFNYETVLSDTTGLYNEIKHDEHLVEIYAEKLPIPGKEYRFTNETFSNRPVCFVVQSGNKGDSNSSEKFYITFQPQRHKNVRCLLVPLTVALDAVSWPVQIVVGIIMLSKVPLS